MDIHETRPRGSMVRAWAADAYDARPCDWALDTHDAFPRSLLKEL